MTSKHDLDEALAIWDCASPNDVFYVDPDYQELFDLYVAAYNAREICREHQIPSPKQRFCRALIRAFKGTSA